MWRHITDLRNTSDGVVLLVLSLFAPFSVFNELRRTVHVVYLQSAPTRDRAARDFRSPDQIAAICV